MQIDKTLLKHLIPIKQLQSEHREIIAEQSQMAGLEMGGELTASAGQQWFVYLIQGKLNLIEFNKPDVLLDADDERANYPLFSDAENRVRYVAQTESIIVRFNKQVFNAFIEQELIVGEETDAVKMSEVEGSLFNEIMHAYKLGNLKLPSLPDIALKVKKALAAPDVSAEDVAHIVSADPAIATRLVHVANGPLNRGVEPIDSIQGAIVRLGLQTSKELVTSFAIKQLFSSRSKMLNQRMYELYDHSIDIAAISFALSKQSGMLSPDHMLLAGLLHEIGVIPILNYIDETGLVITDEAELDNIIARLKSAVGSMVIKYWELPDDLITVVEQFENWQRENSGEVDACDMIIIAQIYYRLKHQQLDGLPKINMVPAFKKLYPGNQDPEFAKNVFQQAHEEITLIMQLLKM